MLITMPPSLSAASLEKIVRSALADQKLKVDPRLLAKELRTLEQQIKAIDTSLFDPVKLATAEEAEERLALLEADGLKPAQLAAAQAGKVAALGQKSHAELKSNKAVDKDAVGAMADVAEDAKAYAASLLGAAQRAAAALKAEVARLQQAEQKAAQAAKKGGPGESAEEAEREKSLEIVGGRIATAMKLARDAGPTKPMPFMIGVLKKQVFVYVAKAVSGSTPARIKGWLQAGSQSVTIYRGNVVFEDKAHCFVGVNIPAGGFAVRIQRALMELTGKRYKIRVRRPTGETDEAGGGDDDAADDVLENVAAQGGKDAALAARARDQERRLQPALRQVLRAGGPLAELADALMRKFDKAVAAKKFDEALAQLDEIEAKVVKAAEAERAARSAAEKEIAKRLAELKPQLAKALGQGGDTAKKVKKEFDALTNASREAARTAAKGGFDTARRQLDQLEKTVDWALSQKSLAEKAQDVQRGAKKLADDAQAKARQKADAAVAQAQAELKKRRDALRKRFDEATAAGGKGAEELKKRLAEAEQAIADGARTGAKETFAKAHRALDAAEKAADWALSERSAQDKLDDVERAARQKADAIAKQVDKQRQEAGKQILKIADAARRAEVMAMMKKVEAERLAAQKLGDAKAQAEAYAKVLKKFENTAETAAKTAAQKVKEGVDDAVENAAKAARRAFG
jgi:colicin import membrane protein